MYIFLRWGFGIAKGKDVYYGIYFVDNIYGSNADC